MIIRELELTNYRSYTYLKTFFDKKINVLIGENGSGKTNLVEAIHYLSLARSFRTTDDLALIHKGSPYTKIKAIVEEGDLQRTIEVVLSPEGKKILVNFKPIAKISQLTEVVNVLVFEPRDVMIFDDLPKVRRRFLDTSLTKLSLVYLKKITEYEKVLKERNELLKQNNPDRHHLSILTSTLISLSEPIVTLRHQHLMKINEVLSKIVGLIKGESFRVKLHYVPYAEPGPTFVEQANRIFEKNLEQDLKRKTTSTGIHREDFVVVYEDQAIASFGSQGENRLVAIALKLSPYFLIETQEKRPIVVLDDVLSELDHKTQQRLLTFLEKLQQVFVTTTHYPNQQHIQYRIKNNTITRRTE